MAVALTDAGKLAAAAGLLLLAAYNSDSDSWQRNMLDYVVQPCLN